MFSIIKANFGMKKLPFALLLAAMPTLREQGVNAVVTNWLPIVGPR